MLRHMTDQQPTPPSYEPLPEDWETALFVVAHPDDIEYGGAAAVARWTGQGKRIVYCMVTSGEAGIDGLHPDESGPLREGEEIASARVVGVDEVEFLRLPDGVLEYGVELRRAIAAVVRKHRPDIAMTINFRETFGGTNLNQADHIAVGRALLDAVRDAGNRWIFPEQLTDGLEPWGGVRAVWSGSSPQATHAVDVTDTFQAGVASLKDNPTKEQVLATGFNRNHKITQEGGVIDEEYRIEYVTDRTNTFAKAFLALTFECAHCHDHKYDPISQKDYYRTFAFFNRVPEKGLVGDITLASLADPPRIKITTKEINEILTFINKKDTTPVEVMVMKDSSWRRPTYILTRGVYDAHGEQVSIGLPPDILPFDSIKYGDNRLGLANWLFDKKNPLTARVFVNRMWQEFFGRGLVKTSGDFGMQGEMPSHPELLDWLAVDFREHGWNTKRLIKQLVMSATYRQSAIISKEKLAADPDNIFFARSSRKRLTAEGVRDLALASSGLLIKDIGGPSMKVYQPKGIWESSTSGRGVLARYVQDHGDDLYRRGLYSFIKRTVPPPGMLVFDASNRDQCEVNRMRTNTPLQALLLLNDPVILESARVFAERLMLDKSSADEKIKKAFQSIICRTPKKEEFEKLIEYYNQEKINFDKTPEKAKQFVDVGEYAHEQIKDVTSLAALMQVVQTIYNLDEAITKS